MNTSNNKIEQNKPISCETTMNTGNNKIEQNKKINCETINNKYTEKQVKEKYEDEDEYDDDDEQKILYDYDSSNKTHHIDDLITMLVLDKYSKKHKAV